mgnify:FL=1
MKVRWLGHSCFKLTESTGTSVLTDPYSLKGMEMPVSEADIVTVSHHHRDHDYLAKVKKPYRLVDSPIFTEIDGVMVMGTKTYHDNEQGAERGENIVFKYRMDGLDVCHMGDIGEECTIEIVQDLMPVDILLIPVGGTYTIDAEEAKKYVDALMPDIVIPMHYKTKDNKLDIDKVDEFLKLFDEEDIVYLESDTAEFDREDIDHEYTKVLVFDLPEA